MNIHKITSNSPEQTRELGVRIGRMAEPGDVILLTGELGAGKTCLTQGIAWGLGIEGYAQSPTFVIMRELYGRLTLYHIDLYRLDDIDESADLGLDEYFYGRGICVVEWAEKAMSIMPKNHLGIEIKYISDDEREFEMKPHGERYVKIVENMEQSQRMAEGSGADSH